MRILVAAGGTGGHIHPALAVLRSLEERRPDLEVRWLGGHRGLEGGIVPSAGYRFDRLWLRSLRTVDLSVASLLDPFRLVASLPQAAARLIAWRPDVIYTTGGYVAIPTLAAAAALRIPSLLWEGNLLPGRSVRATARLASALAVSYAGTLDRLPGRPFVTGTPVRALAGIARDEARRRLRLPPDGPVVLIFGGSQAVRRFERALADALPALVSRVAVLHLTGESAFPDAQRRRQALPEAQRERYRPYPVLREDMAAALVAADLLVGRAGSSTLAEAAAAGLPAVIVPYPHAAAHQGANVTELVAAGAAVVVADDAFDADALIAATRLLDDPERLGAMRAAARSLGRPGAADATAELLLALAERRPLPDRGEVDTRSRAAA
jgi:UDP-N-acetylglucosamine--N-acetylmuramyl-(pentapeptide) pyrophosphoryl-undecaprenol N-acetylglucosamine transferase